MRTILAVLMFTAMVQGARADDDNGASSQTTATTCITGLDGTVKCL